MIEGLMMKDAVFHLNREVSPEDAERLRLVFTNLEGVESFQTEGDTVCVIFYPEILSISTICENLVKLSYEIVQDEKPRNPFKRFIGNMAKSNQKTFGSERLDCCTINRKFKRR
jgi:hypothetical protein